MNFMSPIVHENVFHKQSPLDRIPKQKKRRGSIDAYTCTNTRYFFSFKNKCTKKREGLSIHVHTHRDECMHIVLHTYL